MIETAIEVTGEVTNELELEAKLECDVVRIIKYATPTYENGVISYDANAQGVRVEDGELIL